MVDVVCSAPGKIILFGEHSVVHGRPAVAASAGGALRCYARVREAAPPAAASAAAAPRVTLRLDSLGVSLGWALSDLRSQLHRNAAATAAMAPAPSAPVGPVDGELREALDAAAAAAVSGLADGETVREAVLAFLFLFGSIWLEAVAGSRTAAGGDVLVHVWSTLPVGAGMGSSASYSVALAAALLHAAEARDAGAAAADTASKDGEAASVALRTAANKWAFECERLFHGAPSGIDNTVCSLGALCSLSQRAGVRACGRACKWGLSSHLILVLCACLVWDIGGAVLFTMGSEPEPVAIPAESRLRILVTNTKVPGRSTKRMVAAVSDLVTGPLGKAVGEPLLDAMGASARNRKATQQQMAYSFVELSPKHARVPSSRCCLNYRKQSDLLNLCYATTGQVLWRRKQQRC